MLLLWDCIFLPLPFAFQNDCQSKPIDFGSTCFYEARKPFVDHLLTRIDGMSDEEVRSFVETSIENHRGLVCPLNWDHVDEEWLKRLAFHLGGHRLSVICRRFVKNLSLYCSGLPDLTLLREDSRGDAMSHVLFVEVKGERDKLMDNQSDWIEFFQQNMVNFELCQVGVWSLHHGQISHTRETGSTQYSAPLVVEESSNDTVIIPVKTASTPPTKSPARSPSRNASRSPSRNTSRSPSPSPAKSKLSQKRTQLPTLPKKRGNCITSYFSSK